MITNAPDISTYDKCNNLHESPGAPTVLCERPRAHLGVHRKTLGGATLTWPNTDTPRDRSVRVELPTFARDGHVWIGSQEVSSVVAGVGIDAHVHELTRIRLDLNPGHVEVSATGEGEISASAHTLLVALGWTPPSDVMATEPDDPNDPLAPCNPIGCDAGHHLIGCPLIDRETQQADEWRVGIERMICLDPSCGCDPERGSILVDDVTELSPADLRGMIIDHRERTAASS